MPKLHISGLGFRVFGFRFDMVFPGVEGLGEHNFLGGNGICNRLRA